MEPVTLCFDETHKTIDDILESYEWATGRGVRTELDDRLTSLVIQYVQQQQADNARLRAALVKIAHMPPRSEGDIENDDVGLWYAQVCDYARQAIESDGLSD